MRVVAGLLTLVLLAGCSGSGGGGQSAPALDPDHPGPMLADGELPEPDDFGEFEAQVESAIEMADWVLFAGFATARVDGHVYTFTGVGPEILSPEAQALAHDQGASVVGCASLAGEAMASFHAFFDRNLRNSVSMWITDDDGSASMGLFAAELNEEWSGRGTLTAQSGFMESQERYFGIMMEFVGEASENFSARKSPVTVDVQCYFRHRDDGYVIS